MGFINKEARIVIPAAYDWAGIFTYNLPITVAAQGCKLVRVSEHEHGKELQGGKWGAIDKHGKVIVPIIYDEFTLTSQPEENGGGIVTFVQGNQKYQLFYTRWGNYKLIEVL